MFYFLEEDLEGIGTNEWVVELGMWWDWGMPGALGKAESSRGGQQWDPVEEGTSEGKRPKFQNGIENKHWQV